LLETQIYDASGGRGTAADQTQLYDAAEAPPAAAAEQTQLYDASAARVAVTMEQTQLYDANSGSGRGGHVEHTQIYDASGEGQSRSTAVEQTQLYDARGGAVAEQTQLYDATGRAGGAEATQLYDASSTSDGGGHRGRVPPLARGATNVEQTQLYDARGPTDHGADATQLYDAAGTRDSNESTARHVQPLRRREPEEDLDTMLYRDDDEEERETRGHLSSPLRRRPGTSLATAHIATPPKVKEPSSDKEDSDAFDVMAQKVLRVVEKSPDKREAAAATGEKEEVEEKKEKKDEARQPPPPKPQPPANTRSEEDEEESTVDNPPFNVAGVAEDDVDQDEADEKNDKMEVEMEEKPKIESRRSSMLEPTQPYDNPPSSPDEAENHDEVLLFHHHLAFAPRCSCMRLLGEYQDARESGQARQDGSDSTIDH